MKDFLMNLFSENSQVSSMRVMAMISLLVGSGIAVYGVERGTDLNQIAMLSGVFVAAAFGGKFAQKAVESKKEDKQG